MKKFLSILLVACLLLSVMPMQSFASSGPYAIWAYFGDYMYVTISHTEAYPGEWVTVVPHEGYEIDKLEVCPSDSDPLPVYPDGNGYGFTMPEGNVDLLVTVKTPDGGGAPRSINLLSAGGGNPTADKYQAAPGETITIYPNPDAGNVVQRIQIDYYSASGGNIIYDIPDNGTSFVMPDDVQAGGDVKVVVYYVRDPSAPPSGVPHAVVFTPDPNGDGSVSATQAMAGETITVTVTPIPGYKVSLFYAMAASGTNLSYTRVSKTQFTVTMPDEDLYIGFLMEEGEEDFEGGEGDDGEVEKETTVPMHRMYDPNSGEHFYTGSDEERDILVSKGWKYEGIGFNFPREGAPVHRLYEPVSGEHLYTMDEAEKDRLLAEGWSYEEVAFNSAPSTEVPQYRLHNPNATRGAYHFTSCDEERDILIGYGWEYQGIGWYSCWE